MSDENKIYVGGLACETTSDGLRAHFSKFGEITDCIVMNDKVSGRSRGFGFASFKEFGAMNAALGTSNVIDGREVSCKKAIRENPQMYVQGVDGIYNSIKIFVGGLPATCDYEKFTSYFKQFGQIEDAVVMIDNQTQRHRGFGYVTFSDCSAVEAALMNYATNQIDGKWIEVKRCIPQDKMTPSMSLKGKGKGSKGVSSKAKSVGPSDYSSAYVPEPMSVATVDPYAAVYRGIHYGMPQMVGAGYPQQVYGVSGWGVPYGSASSSDAYRVSGGTYVLAPCDPTSPYAVTVPSSAYGHPSRYGGHRSSPY